MFDEEYIVSGHCAVSWEVIRDLFRQNFIDHLDIGATLCIYYQGKCVVDLAGGWFDFENHTRPYTHDTLQMIYSTGKGVMATALALCVQRGLLDYEERIATYWPEFGQNGKKNVKVKDLLSHRAGLVVIDDDDGLLKVEDTLDDPTKITHLLAKQKPYWEPDVGGHGYHALTFGYLVSELIRRIDFVKHRSMGQFIQEEIAQAIGDCEYFVGNCLPDQCQIRVSPCIPPRKTASVENQSELSQLQTRIFTLNGLIPSSPINGKDKHLSPINGFTNARSLARIYASLLFTESLITSKTLAKAILNNTPENEPDQILSHMTTKFSQGGYMLDSTVVKDFGKCFGHWGIEKALPMLVLGVSCILAVAIIFGILCGNMIRARRKIERIQHENEEKKEQYPIYIITSQSQNSIKLPISTNNNKINNTNQSAAILSSTTKINEYRSSSSRMEIALDPTFKIHPYHLCSFKRIVEL
ncbi:unnamed protein product [Rotaria sordida]|uniref:Beta-lactamase-related domain-containing protein n=1 Tax=Rotaria sordida TaxID=392033 RepID=A0A819DLW7_9BILA|nr:unnamed protein product [Rotaria sordida]